MKQWAQKAVLFVLWPALAAVLLVGVMCVMAGVWVLIPFGKVVEKDGSYSLEFSE